jgi:branched-chain amino acid transport system ATP-binding protein
MSIEVKNLSVCYFKDVEILHDLSLKFEKEKITSIIGPNGAGKSTFLKSLYGLLRPVRGKIFFENEDITSKLPHMLVKKGISFLPQERSVFPHLTVEENLELGGWSIRRDTILLEQRINELYDMFPNLKENRRKAASLLSGGEARMLEVARALVVNPKVLLIDEPTAGLAPKYLDIVYNYLKDLNRNRKLTIILVDQNINEAIDISDYVCVFEMGRKKVEGSADKFKGEKIKEIIKGWFAV